MERTHIQTISKSLSLPSGDIKNTLALLEEGATVPFISRYRKERTGGLDETQVIEIREAFKKLVDIERRKSTILSTIRDQGLLTSSLQSQINSADTFTELEDLYLPFKPKKRTRASVAIKKGLEPLARILFQQNEANVALAAKEYLNDEVTTKEEALQGARDIIAEWISEDQRSRELVRRIFEKEAMVYARAARGKEEEGQKYKDYFEFQQSWHRCPSHRILAIKRGFEEGYLNYSVTLEAGKAVRLLQKHHIKGDSEASIHIKAAVEDGYKRLIRPSIESEFKTMLKERADDEAISVFTENLRQLLLAPPLGQKRTLAIDPGYKSGCKVVCLDGQGNLLHNENIYPHAPQNEKGPATRKISSMVESYSIEAIAIGNGTAGRETEAFIRKIKYNRDVRVYVVNENGASVYSASPAAREEFPQYDVTVRGAVSIGRRLMDPLAELVKIDPKSIGVGQYQHDVNQVKLKEGLDQVVESCVNHVGVNLNTASKHLLTYVSGLGPQLAGNIVEYRRENGPLPDREALKKVKRMGDKAYEQAAGFLRIENSPHPLDNSAVHPERYPIVEKMAKDLNTTISELVEQSSLLGKIDIRKYVTDEAGIPTLKDILAELEKPGRDPRQGIKVFEFHPDVFKIEDLRTGMILPGIVTNITKFGAFVDVGVKQDGLVHISNMKDEFVSDPGEVVHLNQHVMVKVLEIDKERKRVQLSLKDVEGG